MKLTLVTFALLASVLAISNVRGQSVPYNIPTPIQPGAPGLISSGLVYPMDAKPTPQCHASTIVELSDGMMAAWFGGTHEKNADVGIWTAQWRSGKWSHPVQVANGFVNDSLRYPCWNPVLFKPRGGPLMLFYKVGPSPGEWWGMLMTSADEGRTWTVPRRLGEHQSVGYLLGPVKNKPLQLADESIVCPSSTEIEVPVSGSSDMREMGRDRLEITRDFGKTWEVIGPMNEGIELTAIQPSILSYKKNAWQILCRTREGV